MHLERYGLFYSIKLGFLEALTMCVFPYIPMDLVKLVAAVIIGSQVRKILIRQNLIS